MTVDAIGVLALLATATLLALDLRRRRAQRAAQRLEQARLRDGLTGLDSRLAFEQQLRALAGALRDDGMLAVLVIDIYRFARLNARWGRAAGDCVLRELALRLQRLGDRAALARVGPDAFALAFVDVGPERCNALVDSVVALMRDPFDAGADLPLALSASVGCALYPADADSPSRLLGVAEAAVFGQVERRQQEQAADLDPYGAEAARRLAWAVRFVKGRLRDFEREYLTRLQGPDVAIPLRDLLTELGLRGWPGDGHVALLLRPTLDAARHRERALQLGHLLAALGVPAKCCIRATSWLQQEFGALSQRLPGRLSQRKLLLDVVSLRLQADMALQQEGADTLQQELYRALRAFDSALPQLPRRVDLLDAAIALLSRLPYVVFCAAYTQGADGRAVLEAETHAHRLWLESRPEQALAKLRAEDIGARAWTRAWSSARLELADDTELAALQAPGVRSLAALPALDPGGGVHTVVLVYGRLPAQFATAAMRSCLDGAAQALARELARVRHAAAHPALPADQRSAWRQRLFGGGLRMHMQPIVHLPSAACTKVEALARLQLDERTLLTPGRFLPVLGQHELDRLFLDGLNLSLQALLDWERQGLSLDLSLNLPPSTLRHADCVDWVRSGLERRGIDPRRLSLEILEDRDVATQATMRDTTERLRALGVRLVLDDLGAGYSSLLRLNSLPIDMVKVDQGLVHGIVANNPRAVPLVAGLVDLARRLDLGITIEGLETQILLEYAQYLQADFGQGMAISPPLEPRRVPGWVRAWRMPELSGIAPFASMLDPDARATRRLL